MASVQESMNQAVRQLGDLSASQKIAIGLGLVLVAGSVAWLGQWATTPEMTALMQQPLSAEDLARVTAGLDAAGESYKVQGNQILVKNTANRAQLWAQLQQADRMPADTSMGFTAMVKESNPWLSQEENNRRWTVAMKTELEHVLKQFSGVRNASVFLNLTSSGPRFSRNRAENTASVSMTLSSGEPISRGLALSAAKLVAGAVQGLPLHNVEVVDGNGSPVALWDEEGGAAEGIQRRQRELEQQIARKIRDQLSFDRRIRVNVQVDMDLTARENNATVVGDAVEISREQKTEKTNRARKGGVPGVEPNVGISAAAGEAGGDSSSTEVTTTTQQPGSTVTRESTPAGGIKSVFAAVNLSRSFIESVLKKKNPDNAKLTDKQIADEFELQKAMVISQVTMLVKPQKPQQVSVNWYYDAPDAEPAAQAGAADSSMQLMSRFGAPAGLGALAIVALAMTLRMSKRREEGDSFGLELGLPRQAIEAARKAAEDLGGYRPTPRRSSGGAGGSGSAEGGYGGDSSASGAPIPMSMMDESVLVAQEVDPGTAQVNQMIEQVSQMADQDIDSLATLVEKWIDSPK